MAHLTEDATVRRGHALDGNLCIRISRPRGIGNQGIRKIHIGIDFLEIVGIALTASRRFHQLGSKNAAVDVLFVMRGVVEPLRGEAIIDGIGELVFLAFVLGDSLRMAWFWISGPYTEAKVSYIGNPTEYYYWWSSAIPEMMDNLTPHILEADSRNWFYLVMNLFVITAIAVWTHSLLIIGGTLFRKYSFVISCLVFILFWVIFGKTMQYFELSMFTSNWEDGKYVSGEVGIPAYILAVLLPLLAVFNYWASFHIFKNFQLITNKWTNYDILKR